MVTLTVVLVLYRLVIMSLQTRPGVRSFWNALLPLPLPLLLLLSVLLEAVALALFTFVPVATAPEPPLCKSDRLVYLAPVQRMLPHGNLYPSLNLERSRSHIAQ